MREDKEGEKMVLAIPPRVTVGCHTYAIRFDEERTRDDGDWGSLSHREQVIRLNPSRPDTQRFSTLLHETLHLIDCVYLNRELSEAQISALSEGMAQALQSLGVEIDWSAGDWGSLSHID